MHRACVRVCVPVERWHIRGYILKFKMFVNVFDRVVGTSKSFHEAIRSVICKIKVGLIRSYYDDEFIVFII